ncbi:LacI family DNA-binding transcriptional regulator [Georgenia sp. SYP-B2076]|uniref:LacI family DNA-binding transcriptional regulator n=1 Tax=Georgenia sp. SYP-B2076 TaxID=2495881 RepID=UPI000F8DA155|nr:LacI family DNA-binding transcriptional regulator [Georgenia sp. SYP-B2076]
MSRNATLKDVAERAGVHPGTASRALNPETRSLVSEGTVRRVLQAAKALAYTPNPMARSLKTNRTMMVGIIVPDLANALFPPIVRGADSVLTPGGYLSIIAETDNDAAREREIFDALLARQVDGLIIASARREDEAVREAADRHLPVVLVNRRDDSARLPAVVGDDTDGVEQAVRHLVDLGHRRIGHLAGPAELSTGIQRARAFRQCMHELGGDLDPALIVSCRVYSEEEGARAARELFDTAVPRPTAVLAGNDQLAVGLYEFLRERGLNVPGDVSVVGYNDMPYVDKLSPPLTTVRVPHARIGAEAARILLRRLVDDVSDATTVSLPVELVVRGSTAARR